MPVAALVVPLLVVTGALVVRKGNDQQPQNPSADPLAPFYQAVGNLAASPVIRYQMSAASEQADVRVISDGTAVGEYGTGISDIQRYQVLTAAGKSYFKDSQGLVHPLLKDQWFIPSPDDGGFSSAADAWPSPAQAAQTLRTVVDRAEPEATETSVDGTPALKAAIKIYGSTRDELYITRQEPYRVLRYIPSEDTARLGRRLGESDRPKPLSGERNGQIDTSALGSFLSLPRAPSKPDPDDYKTRYDFIPQTFDDYNQTFADAVTAIKQTANAADLTIKLRALNDEGQCGTAGCTVSVTVSNTVNPEPAGQIWARMQAQFTINGTPVGSCVTPPQQMPANESSTLSCSDPKAVLPGVKGEYRWYIPWVVYAIANTQDDVDRQVDQLDRQQQQADAFLCVIDSESCTGTQPIDDLAQYRQRQGLPPVAGGGQATMVARLDVGGRTYYGKGGQERTGDRAEADVFQQADTDKVTSPTAVLYVDTKLCETCGDLARIGDLLRNTKIQQVIVVTPSGRRVLILANQSKPVPLTHPVDCADGSGNSFAAGTPVLLADGMSKPIEAITVDDVVRASDPVIGITRAEPVTDLIHHSGPHLMVNVGLAGGAVLRATDHHAFWNVTAGRFIDAIDLHVGDELLASDGRPVTVTSLTTDGAHLTAYNLSVAELHTYYVLAGETAVLVHNDGGEMIGAHGTQITSKTLWLRGAYRIDVENPNPGQRPGQLHFQDQATGAKYMYNFETGEFDGMPNSLKKELAKNFPDYTKGIAKGKTALNFTGC